MFLFSDFSSVGVTSLPMAIPPLPPPTFKGWQMRDCSSPSSIPQVLSAVPQGTLAQLASRVGHDIAQQCIGFVVHDNEGGFCQ